MFHGALPRCSKSPIGSKSSACPSTRNVLLKTELIFSVLPELTDQDLEKIGVVLGDRRKIMRAIRELGGTTPATQSPVIAAAKPQDTAERRQVTVMFSDLVGSTALSARMDPEDLREVISAYQNCVAETVDRFDGFVAKYMGDGVLVYFGYPRAHEDDAERAALDRLMAAGLLFRQGAPPHANYLFKHALVRDAAYGALLREPRRALHACIETLEGGRFPDIAETQPELLAHHCTEAGLIEKAVGLWGKAGQRSMERSALVGAVEQFKRALDQIGSSAQASGSASRARRRR
jgi:hypothetical protein